MSEDSAKVNGQALEVRASETLGVLASNEYFDTLNQGLRFHTDAEGKLKYIPEEIFFDEKRGVVESFRTMKLLEVWGTGDTALYIEYMVKEGKYPQSRYDEFVARLDYKDPKQIDKIKSTCKAYGWPDKIEEQRFTPPLGLGHHQALQGMKDKDGNYDVENRTRILEAAADQGLSVEGVKLLRFKFEKGPEACNHINLEEGYGKCPDCGDEVPYERGAFHATFPVYDPEKQTKEQYLFDCTQALTRQFDEYMDPELKKARKDREARENVVKKIEDETVRTKLLADNANKPIEELEKAASIIITRIALEKGIKTHAEKHIQDVPTREKMVAAALTKKQSVEDFKKDVAKYKEENKAREENINTITKIVQGRVQDAEEQKKLIDTFANHPIPIEEFLSKVVAPVILREQKAAVKDQKGAAKITIDDIKFDLPGDKKKGKKAAATGGEAAQALPKGGGKANGKTKK